MNIGSIINQHTINSCDLKSVQLCLLKNTQNLKILLLPQAIRDVLASTIIIA